MFLFVCLFQTQTHLSDLDSNEVTNSLLILTKLSSTPQKYLKINANFQNVYYQHFKSQRVLNFLFILLWSHIFFSLSRNKLFCKTISFNGLLTNSGFTTTFLFFLKKERKPQRYIVDRVRNIQIVFFVTISVSMVVILVLHSYFKALWAMV